MSGVYGADVAQLDALGQAFGDASAQLDGVASTLGSSIRASASWWRGADAEALRGAWQSTHALALSSAGALLAETSRTLRRNAQEQYDTSTDGGTFASPGVPSPGFSDRPGIPGAPGAQGGGLGGAPPLPGPVGEDISIWGVGATAVKLGTVTAGLAKAFRVGRTLSSFIQASRLASVSSAAASATVFTREMIVTDAIGKAGGVARLFGGIGGGLAIVGGINQMVNTPYDGWRGGVDRGMGALSVIGGAGTLAMMAGVAFPPAGVAIVVGAAVVAGAWALGNLVVDNWDSITGFCSDPGAYLSDGWNDVKDFAGDAADAVGDAAGKVGDAIGDGLSAAGDWVGGLFS